MTGGQVPGSIVGFGLVYDLLGAIWPSVLTHKIKAGPDFSGTMTEAKEPVPPPPGGGAP